MTFGPLFDPEWADPPDEGHAALGQRQSPHRHDETRGQLPQAQAPAVPRRCPAPQPRVDMLWVDRLLQPGQLAPQVARAPEAPVEQRLLEPAVEVLDAAVALRLPGGDEH